MKLLYGGVGWVFEAPRRCLGNMHKIRSITSYCVVRRVRVLEVGIVFSFSSSLCSVLGVAFIGSVFILWPSNVCCLLVSGVLTHDHLGCS